MKDKYTVQVRRYSATDFEYVGTLNLNPPTASSTAAAVESVLKMSATLEGVLLKPNLCNIMVRKNGKLISYKSL